MGSLGGTLKKSLRYVAVLAATTFAVGIIVAPTATAATSVKACLALDTGGVDDHSFNESAWLGANSMKSSKIAVEYLPAASSADFAPNIKKFADKGCTIIIGVGFQISAAIVDSAKLNPKINYAIVDDGGLDHGPKGDQWPGTKVANVKALEFATDQSSFLAGYLAAGYSKTGKVATYGGMAFPSVTIFMNGYAKGVAYYNKVKGKSVKVLGWDTVKQDGTFVGDFSSLNIALQVSKSFEQQGADVIFPVAGGLGAATAGQSLKDKKSVTIWVDSDGFKVVPQYRSVLLSSVIKRVDNSVAAAIKETAAGKFSGTGYMGTLANKGTVLGPYHDLAKKVPAKLQNEIRAIAKKIKSGALKV
ncbi:MAG: BMP family ABC transporter substrate-binding protein [Actinomycetota bacterium]